MSRRKTPAPEDGRRQRPPSEPPRGLAAARLVLGDEELVVFSYPIEAEPTVPTPNLTPAAWDVIAGVVRGESNAAIAARRATSPATVAKQLEKIYRQLGVHSRSELAAWYERSMGSRGDG